MSEKMNDKISNKEFKELIKKSVEELESYGDDKLLKELFKKQRSIQSVLYKKKNDTEIQEKKEELKEARAKKETDAMKKLKLKLKEMKKEIEDSFLTEKEELKLLENEYNNDLKIYKAENKAILRILRERNIK
jgi:hypothetical protein